MIQLTIFEGKLDKLQGDVIHSEGVYPKKNNQISVAMNQEEFNSFLKENNLIVYKNLIKSYEDGEEWGEFSVE